MKTIKLNQVLPYIISVILLIVLLHQCGQASENTSLATHNYEALTDSVKHYKNALGTVTASKKTLQFDNSQLQKIVLDKDKELQALSKEFAKVKSLVKFESRIEFEPIAINFDIPVDLSADSTGRFERSGAVFSDWYSLGYQVNNKGLTIEPFTTWTETTVITGFKKKWLLGKTYVATEITNSNPHIEINEIIAAEVVVPVPWYQKWYVWLGAGIAGGLLIK